jgi:transcriptional regulator with XRE-family HTH domain
METQATRIIAKFGMTQQQLGEALGEAQSTIATWKARGTIPGYQHPTVRELAERLGVTLTLDDWFPPALPDATTAPANRQSGKRNTSNGRAA